MRMFARLLCALNELVFNFATHLLCQSSCCVTVLYCALLVKPENLIKTIAKGVSALEAPTRDDDQCREAREGGDVKFHAMEASGKLQDGVDPVAEASDALRFVKHFAVAEDQLVRFGV